MFTANAGASLGLGQSLADFGDITPLKLSLSVFYKDAITGPTDDHQSVGVSLGAGTSLKLGNWSLSWSLASLHLVGDPPPPDTTPVMPVPPVNSSGTGSWNGHAVTGGGDFTYAHGSWIVPTVTPTGDDRSADTWIGLGGLPEGSAQIRAGTSERSAGGHPAYSAWYEWYGGELRQYLDARYPVGPGDRIDGTFERYYVDTLGTSAYHKITLVDNPPGQHPTHDSWKVTQNVGPAFPEFGSADWLHAPSPGSAHLAVTAPVQFFENSWDTGSSTSGHPIAAGSDQRLQAPTDSTGLSSSVSGLDGTGAGFTVSVSLPAPTATPTAPPTSTPVPSCGYPTAPAPAARTSAPAAPGTGTAATPG